MSNHRRSIVRRLLLPSSLLLSLAGGGWLLWSDRLSPEERAFVGTWYEVMGDGQVRTVEFRPDRTVAETYRENVRELGIWRLENGQLNTYPNPPFVSFDRGFASAKDQIWRRIRSAWDGKGFRPERHFSSLYYHVVCSDDGAPILGRTNMFGCYAPPTDDEYFVRSIDEAIARDEAFRPGQEPVTAKCDVFDASAFTCAG